MSYTGLPELNHHLFEIITQLNRIADILEALAARAGVENTARQYSPSDSEPDLIEEEE